MSDDALRVAAEQAISILTARGGYGYADALHVLRDALASPQPETLDVERLARAMCVVLHPTSDPCNSPSRHEHWAGRFAREYDRLGASE